MFGMQDMVADMLKKAIPPEVMDLLTPENIKEIGDKANAFIVDLRESLAIIKAQNDLIISMLEEKKDDRNTSDSGKRPTRKPRVNSGGIAGNGDVIGE